MSAMTEVDATMNAQIELTRLGVISAISDQAAARLGGSVYTISNTAGVTIGVGYRKTRFYFWDEVDADTGKIAYEEYVGDSDVLRDEPLCSYCDTPRDAIRTAVKYLGRA